MAIERDTDDAVPTCAPWRWQHFCRGIEVYTRDPEPPAGQPFTGCYRGSVRTGGEWRVYPDEVSPEPHATGAAEGGSEEERMAAARGEVERRVAARKGEGAMTVGTNDGDGGAEEPVDLAAWRAEAGESLAISALASHDWNIGGVDAGDGRIIISGGPIPIGHIRVSCVTVGGRDGSREITPEQRDNDALFAMNARDDWPRDAARVLALADRCAALEEALAEALDGWEGTVSDVGFTSYHTIKRLRALLSEGAGAAGKGEP